MKRKVVKLNTSNPPIVKEFKPTVRCVKCGVEGHYANTCTKGLSTSKRKSEPSVKTVEVIHSHKRREKEEVREPQSVNDVIKPLENAKTNSLITGTFINESKSNTSNEVATTTNYGIHTPCLLEGEKVIAFVDGGPVTHLYPRTLWKRKDR